MTTLRVAPTPTEVGLRSPAAVPFLVGLTVCLLPFLSPAGPGNIAPVDVAMAMSIAAALVWAAAARLPLVLPWSLGVGVMMLGGALASVLSAVPGRTGLVLVQDLLLLGWAGVLAAGRHDDRILRAAVLAWCRTAPVMAGLGVLAYLLGVNAISGVNAADGARASYFFGDPNLAGNYFVTSLFVMAACRRPVSTAWRRVSYLLVLTAIVFTGSNGAALTLAIGTVLAFALSRYRSRGLQAGVLTLVAASAAVVILGGFVAPRVDMGAIREKAAGSVPLLRDSVGRSDGSTGERERIVRQGLSVFFDSNATGVGPARTKVTLRHEQASYVKEAHNDYLATLLERGLVGCVGLLLLGWTAVLRCRHLVIDPVPARAAPWVPRPHLLVVVLPVMASAAFFYEVLHFRHLWTWFGLVALLVLMASPRRSQ